MNARVLALLLVPPLGHYEGKGEWEESRESEMEEYESETDSMGEAMLRVWVFRVCIYRSRTRVQISVQVRERRTLDGIKEVTGYCFSKGIMGLV